MSLKNEGASAFEIWEFRLLPPKRKLAKYQGIRDCLLSTGFNYAGLLMSKLDTYCFFFIIN